jgi:hypothetical protein
MHDASAFWTLTALRCMTASMVEKSDSDVTGRAKKPGAKPDRDARLKSALKANMAKRKAQAQKRAKKRAQKQARKPEATRAAQDDP